MDSYTSCTNENSTEELQNLQLSLTSDIGRSLTTAYNQIEPMHMMYTEP